MTKLEQLQKQYHAYYRASEEELQTRAGKAMLCWCISLVASMALTVVPIFPKGWGWVSAIGVVVALIALIASFRLCLALAPLKRSESACQRALSCVETSVSARQWRDAVLTNGRQLRQFDLWAMEALQQDDAKEDACKRLHNIG